MERCRSLSHRNLSRRPSMPITNVSAKLAEKSLRLSLAESLPGGAIFCSGRLRAVANKITINCRNCGKGICEMEAGRLPPEVFTLYCSHVNAKPSTFEGKPARTTCSICGRARPRRMLVWTRKHQHQMGMGITCRWIWLCQSQEKNHTCPPPCLRVCFWGNSRWHVRVPQVRFSKVQ